MDTTLLVTFLGLWAAFALVLWGGSMFLQAFFYEAVAGLLPVRAAVGALVLAAFLTFWTYTNTRASTPDRYGTLLEFNPTSRIEFTEFDAVRKARGSEAEQAVAFVKGPKGTFVEVADASKEFRTNATDYLTVAMDVKEGDAKSRFDAELKNGQYMPGHVFRDKNRRSIEFGNANAPGPIFASSRAAFFGAIFLNLGAVLVWFVVLWPAMNFGVSHSAGLALVLGGATIFLLMPLLFHQNQGRGLPPVAAQRP